jgi:hypothetical protein
MVAISLKALLVRRAGPRHSRLCAQEKTRYYHEIAHGRIGGGGGGVFAKQRPRDLHAVVDCSQMQGGAAVPVHGHEQRRQRIQC